MRLKDMIKQGVSFTLAGDQNRAFWLGAVGVRKDGAIVRARNEKTKVPTPCAHAEARLCKKLGKDSPMVIVVRLLRDGNLAMAKPCPNCERALKRHRVKKVFYSTENGIQMLW